MIGFHGIGNSHMFEDEEMGSYHPEIENGSRNVIMKPDNRSFG